MQSFKPIAIAAGIALVVYWIYSAVVSIPDRYIADVTSLSKALERQQNKLADLQQTYKQVQDSDDWAFLKPYAESENWAEKFSLSAIQLKTAQDQYDNQVTPILDRNHEQDVAKLIASIKSIQATLAESIKLGLVPNQRITLIKDGRQNKERYFARTSVLLNQAQTHVDDLITIAEQSKADHSQKIDDISEKLAVTTALLATAKTSAETVQSQYESSQTDYALFSDSYLALVEQNKQIAEDVDTKSQMFKQLDRNYVKVLSDQKVDYFVTIGRANWCNRDGCGRGSEMTYPPAKVDDNTYVYFQELDINTIAKVKRRNRIRLQIPQNRWDALNIDPYYHWNKRQPYAEYWVNATPQKTYHKYTIIENGKATELDWQQVPNPYFWSNYENLGMAVVTKPIGFYESEAIDSAEPVGMAMIAKPEMVNGVAKGSNKYGEWRQDSNGTSFWFYYAMYRMMGDFMMPNRYSYNDWSGYNSRSRGSVYYGRNNEYGTFGRSTYSNTRYSNSDFSRRNPGAVNAVKTGKRSSVISSIRGAGSANRGKGPSRSGK